MAKGELSPLPAGSDEDAPPFPSERPSPEDVARQAEGRSRERTVSGLTTMMVGFALVWIPYISFVGYLVILAGVYLLWSGRRAFPSQHQANVVLAGTCILLGIAVVIGAALWLVESVLSAASAGGSVAQIGNQLGTDLGVVFLLGIVAASLTGLGYVLLPYALADRTTQLLLWAALALGVLIALLQYAILYPLLSIAVGDATSGLVLNTAPILALQTQSAEIGALQILPSAIYLVAYHRSRQRVRSGAGPTPVRAATD